MKKIIITFLMILVCPILSACDPSNFMIMDSHLQDIISIELIHYDNQDQKHFISWVPNQFDNLKTFELDNYTILETLEVEYITSFLNEFKSTDILHNYYAYDSPKDICIKLNYENGNFLIIWSNYKEHSFAGYIGEYLSDGQVLSFWGCFSYIKYYESLVENYFSSSLY